MQTDTTQVQGLTFRQRLEAQYEALTIKRELKIRQARINFWVFCQCKAPKFYTDDKLFLKEICDTLQALYEHRLFKDGIATKEEALQRIATGEEPIRKLMLNMPPRFGKTRTVNLFSEWVFGVETSQSIICATYNETLSSKSSRQVRDGISETKLFMEDIIYNDIFPVTRIKRGDASIKSWSLEGSHFSYLATSFNASMTGMGALIGIIDDSIKTHEDALNDDLLEKQWDWYLNTYLSRLEEGALQIVMMTRWAKKDICGRLKATEPGEWYNLKYEAYDEITKKMLHEKSMSRRSYMKRRRLIEKSHSDIARMIFFANYHQRPMDMANVLYRNLKEYRVIAKDGKYVVIVEGVQVASIDKSKAPDGWDGIFEEIIAYYDTADEGADWLAGFIVGIIQGQGFILDVHYTDAHMENTEPDAAEMLYRNGVKRARIESNNGGRGWGRNVKRDLWNNWKSRNCDFELFYQKKNKESRILGGVTFVINNIFFPQGWADKWPELYEHLTGYQKGGKNQKDDAPDALTGIAEMIKGTGIDEYFEEEPEEKQKQTESRNKLREAANRV